MNYTLLNYTTFGTETPPTLQEVIHNFCMQIPGEMFKVLCIIFICALVQELILPTLKDGKVAEFVALACSTLLLMGVVFMLVYDIYARGFMFAHILLIVVMVTACIYRVAWGLSR